MAEETPTPEGAPETGAAPAQPEQQAAPGIHILAQYIKDLSFENPGMRQPQTQPNIDLGIDVSATAHEDGNNIYEVSIKIQAKAIAGTEVMFLLELDFSGLFQLQGFQPQDIEPALLIECPRLIFPFARRIIADVSRDGGFPPLLIDPIDFRQLYLSQRQKAAEGAAATSLSTPQQV